jgi:hypothetical protein
VSEPQIAPSRARVALAARAGLRPWSPWLVSAALCLVAAAAVPEELPASGAVLRAAWAGESDGLRDLVFGTWSIVLVGSLVVAVAAVAGSGGLGWRANDVRLGRVGKMTRAPIVQALVGAGLLALAAVALGGAPAGAARAVDASGEGLSVLWLAWLRRGLVAIGLVSLVAALTDLWLGKRALWRALHQTRAEVQAQ